MLTTIPDLPDGVIGFDLQGKVHAEDYRDVVLPAIEQARRAGDIRAVIVMEKWDGMEASAVWEDLKVGVEHLRSWKRIAVVSDIEWVKHMMTLFGWMTPGEAKCFPVAERDEAIAWVAA
jgi:hypothetical protein